MICATMISMLLLVLVVLVLLYFISFSSIRKIQEAYGGRGGGRHHIMSGGGRGRGRRHYIGGIGGGGYSRPHHYGGGYRDYGYAWYSPWYLFRGNYCKDGCTNIGNGIWGCQYPGNRPTDCQFSSDCDGCNYY